MRKTIDLTKQEIEKVEEYKKRNSLKSFSAAVKSIIDVVDIDSTDVPDDNFALIADALVKIDEKIEQLSIHVAPKSAGEVKS